MSQRLITSTTLQCLLLWFLAALLFGKGSWHWSQMTAPASPSSSCGFEAIVPPPSPWSHGFETLSEAKTSSPSGMVGRWKSWSLAHVWAHSALVLEPALYRAKFCDVLTYAHVYISCHIHCTGASFSSPPPRPPPSPPRPWPSLPCPPSALQPSPPLNSQLVSLKHFLFTFS